MKDNLKDTILTGTITNIDTGETSDIIPRYLFPNGCSLSAIIKVQYVRPFSYTNANNEIIREVTIDCLALDYLGDVFALNLYFLPESLEEEQKIISESTKGKIMVANGRCAVELGKESFVRIFDPKYETLPAEFKLEDVEEVFRFNDESNKNRLT